MKKIVTAEDVFKKFLKLSDEEKNEFLVNINNWIDEVFNIQKYNQELSESEAKVTLIELQNLVKANSNNIFFTKDEVLSILDSEDFKENETDFAIKDIDDGFFNFRLRHKGKAFLVDNRGEYLKIYVDENTGAIKLDIKAFKIKDITVNLSSMSEEFQSKVKSAVMEKYLGKRVK
jgi:hypothetical protein